MGPSNPLPAGARKAAILLSFLGEDEAAPILRNLPSKDLERITDEVANLTRTYLSRSPSRFLRNITR
jgi:flagellar motor switch protein FliG